MPSYEQVILMGNLGRDAEMRYTPSGETVTTFSMAVTRWSQDAATNEWKGKTKWFNIHAWGKLAERCNDLVKGEPVMVTGTLIGDDAGGPRMWTDRDGNKRASFELNADKVVRLRKKEGDDSTAQVTDDIPF